jgi:hypothetical protein
MDKLLTFLENQFQNQLLAVVYDNGTFNGNLIEKRKDDLNIIESYDSIESILGKLSDDPLIPVALGVHDSGVLHYVHNDHFTEESAIHFFEEEVPNSEKGDFVICHYQNIIAFGRQQLIDTVVGRFDGHAANIVHLSLAPVFGVELAKVLVTQEQQPVLADTLYSFENTRVFVEKTDQKLGAVLDGNTYDQDALVTLSIALDHFGGYSRLMDHATYGLSREELIVRRTITKMKMPVLTGLLLVFLLNGLFYFSLNGSNLELKDKAGTLEVLDKKLRSLDTFIASNQELLKSSQHGTFSILADQVGANTTNGISLTRLTIYPEEGERSSRVFAKGKIAIEGIASSAQSMASWISKLEKEPWVREIEKQHYEASATAQSGKFQLTIRLYVEES